MIPGLVAAAGVLLAANAGPCEALGAVKFVCISSLAEDLVAIPNDALWCWASGPDLELRWWSSSLHWREQARAGSLLGRLRVEHHAD